MCNNILHMRGISVIFVGGNTHFILKSIWRHRSHAPCAGDWDERPIQPTATFAEDNKDKIRSLKVYVIGQLRLTCHPGGMTKRLWATNFLWPASAYMPPLRDDKASLGHYFSECLNARN